MLNILFYLIFPYKIFPDIIEKVMKNTWDKNKLKIYSKIYSHGVHFCEIQVHENLSYFIN